MEGKHDAALHLFRRTLKADRTYPGANLRMAQIYFSTNRRSEADYHANCELAQQTSDELTLLELGNQCILVRSAVLAGKKSFGETVIGDDAGLSFQAGFDACPVLAARSARYRAG